MNLVRSLSAVTTASICTSAGAGITILTPPTVSTEITQDEFLSTPTTYQLFSIDSKVGLTGRSNLIRSGFVLSFSDPKIPQFDAFSVLLENGGTGQFMVPSTPETAPEGMQMPKQIDFNSDGVEDIVFLDRPDSFSRPNSFSLFVSDSLTEFSATFGQSFPGGYGIESEQVDSFDNDFADVVVALKGGAVLTSPSFSWYYGDNAGSFFTGGSQTLPSGAFTGGDDFLVTGDFDNDGLNDVCLAAQTVGVSDQATLYVYSNTGVAGANQYPFSPSSTTAGPVNSMGLNARSADFNGDGAPDVLFLHQTALSDPFEDPRGIPNIWLNKNDGSGTFNQPTAILPNRYHKAEIADMDRDGDPDIVLARMIESSFDVYDSAEVVVLENTGLFSGIFSATTLSVPLLANDRIEVQFVLLGGGQRLPYFDLSLGDFYGNGQIDIAVGCTYEIANDRNDLFVWKNDTALPTPCEGDVNNDSTVDLADLNLVLANFGSFVDPPGSDGDANLDGKVNLADLNLVLANFGETCGGARAMARDGGSDGEFPSAVLDWIHLHGFETWQAWLAGVEDWEDDQIMQHMEFLAAFLNAVGGRPAE
jgi:hypothetical protein